MGVWVAPTKKKKNQNFPKMKSRFFKMKPKSLQNIKATFWSSCKSSWKSSFPVDFISWRGKTASELFKASVHMNLTSTASQLLDNQWSNSLITALLCLQHFFSKRSGLVPSSLSCVCLGCWRNSQEEMGFTLESVLSINTYYTCKTSKRWLHSVI